MDEVNLNENKKIIVKSIIFSMIFLIIYAISVIFCPRIILYSNIFGNFKFLIIALYFFMLMFSLVFGIYSLIIILLYKDKNIEKIKDLYKLRKILDIPNFLASCFSVIFFIAIFIVTPCNVSGKSMENTYHDGDKILCTNLFYTPKIDDVIVFDSTNYTGSNGDLYIKRVLAVEDNILYYNKDEKALYVNDIKVINNLMLSSYLNIIGSDDINNYDTTFIVPKNKLLVVGDNRIDSYDSRKFGLIDEKDVFGHVFIKIYPFSKTVKNIYE